MNTFGKLFSTTAIAIAMLAAASLSAAQNGGGGGGGGGNKSGGTVESGVPLTFTAAIGINGSTPSWSGNYTLTHSLPGYYTFDTLQVQIKAKPVNLPDNSTLNVTYYFSDALTGLPLASVAAPSLLISKGQIAYKSTLSLYNPAFSTIYRHLDQVVVTAADGTVVVVAKG